MNLNISRQDIAGDVFKKIKITFENFEELCIDAKYIYNLDLYTEKFKDEIEYESVILIFSPQLKKDKPDIAKAIFDRKDITYIDVLTEESDLEILVPYEDDREGKNRFQKACEFEGGDIMLEISKNGGLA